MSIRIDGTNTTANPGITGTDTDTGLQFGTDEVKVVTGGTERVTVDSAGRIGVNQSSPARILHVGSSGTAEANVRIEGGADYFEFRLKDSDNALTIHKNIADAGSSEAVRIQSGGGISFNGDTAAANALDDYEEGTWTPAISNTGYTFTYSTQEGQYTKIGRLVTLRFRIVVTARSGSASGGHPIINLPLTSDGTMDGGNFRYVMPSELVVHKVGTTTSSGAKTLLFGGFGNSNTSNFWVNNPTVTNTNPFDLGSDFNLGGVITYTSNA